MLRTKAVTPLFLTTILLMACGGAPSEADMTKAIDKQIQAEMTAAKQFMGGAGASMAEKMAPKLENLKKIGCKEDGEKAYRCDIEIEITQNGATNKAPVNMRFIKGSEGWMGSK